MKDGIFTVEFLQNLPSDTLEALYQLCVEFDRLAPVTPASMDNMVEAYAILQAFCNSRRWKHDAFGPLGTDYNQNLNVIVGTFEAIKADTSAQSIQRRSR